MLQHQDEDLQEDDSVEDANGVSWAYNRGVVQQGSTTSICFSRRIQDARTRAVQLDQVLYGSNGVVNMNYALDDRDMLGVTHA